MSTLSEDSRNAPNAPVPARAAGTADAEAIRAAIEPASTLVPNADLRRCRRLRLVHPSDVPVVSGREESTAVAAESYRALRTRFLRLQGPNGVRSVVISSALPSEGKTLTVMSLGLSCARLQDMRVLIIDADLRTRGLSGLMGHPAGPGLAEILVGKTDYEDAILATDQPNFYALAAGTAALAPPELFADPRWKELVAWCSTHFKIVLVDAPPVLPLADFDLIAAACDGVLIVVRAYHTKRELLQKVAAQVDTKRLLGVVFNATAMDPRAGYFYYHSGNHKDK